MKRILLASVWCSLTVVVTQAKTPNTVVPTTRPFSKVAVTRPQTNVSVFRPTSNEEVRHPQTQVPVIHPQTTVDVKHSSTQAVVFHPTTQAEVSHPTTTVTVVHPQTSVAVFHPQTQETQAAAGEGSALDKQEGGKKGLSSTQATTSMSDFKPKQAKNFTASVPDKATPVGGENMNLGNTTNQAEKDSANKSSLLGAQNNQDMQLDPKQTQLKGLEKLLTDRAKVQEKKN